MRRCLIDSRRGYDILSHVKRPSEAKQFENERQKFVTYLKDRGLRLTSGRERVLTAVLETHGHFSCEDLVKQFKDRPGNVSRATIYRTITELMEAQVIRQTAFGKKHNNYEHVYDEKPHHHAYCIRSGKFFELPDLGEEEKYLPILAKMGFEVLGHELHFYGISKECREKEGG